MLVFKIGKELPQFMKVSGAGDGDGGLFVWETWNQRDVGHGTYGTELGQLYLVGGFEGAQHIDYTGVEVTRRHVVLHTIQRFPGPDKISLDAIRVLYSMVHLLKLLVRDSLLLPMLAKS